MYLVASFFNVLLQLSIASGKDVDGKQETKLYENREKENSIFKNVEIQPYNDESL